jgi:hypothetical protein
MARTFLKHIRVKSVQELRHRILKGIDEINEMPVVHRWKELRKKVDARAAAPTAAQANASAETDSHQAKTASTRRHRTR